MGSGTDGKASLPIWETPWERRAPARPLDAVLPGWSPALPGPTNWV
jgi:hypothetical protein